MRLYVAIRYRRPSMETIQMIVACSHGMKRPSPSAGLPRQCHTPEPGANAKKNRTVRTEERALTRPRLTSVADSRASGVYRSRKPVSRLEIRRGTNCKQRRSDLRSALDTRRCKPSYPLPHLKDADKRSRLIRARLMHSRLPLLKLQIHPWPWRQTQCLSRSPLKPEVP